MKLQVLIAIAMIFLASPSVAEPIIIDNDIQTLKSIDDRLFQLQVSQIKMSSSIPYINDQIIRTCVDSIIEIDKISLDDTRIAFETAARMDSEREIVIATVGAQRILENAIRQIRSARILAETERLSCAKVPAYIAEKARLIDQLSVAEAALRPIADRIGIESVARGALRYR